MSHAEEDLTYLAEKVKLNDEARLHIPNDIVRRANIKPGDVIDVRVLPALEEQDFGAAVCLDLIVRKGEYVTIPHHKRRVYGIEVPTTVHADIQLTGRTVELDD